MSSDLILSHVTCLPMRNVSLVIVDTVSVCCVMHLNDYCVVDNDILTDDEAWNV